MTRPHGFVTLQRVPGTGKPRHVRADVVAWFEEANPLPGDPMFLLVWLKTADQHGSHQTVHFGTLKEFTANLNIALAELRQ